MKTRRNFVKGLFGLVGGILVATGLTAFGKTKKSKPVFSDFNTAEERIAFDAGICAAIQVGKGPRPALGWKCYVSSLHHPQRHFQTGMIRTINFKDKTIDVMVLDENPITDSRSSLMKGTKCLD